MLGLYSSSTLMRSAKYSDLTLTCNGADFCVHRAIVCPPSRVLSAACDGDWLESPRCKIEVQDTDIGTVIRMLQFLYTSDYSEDKPDLTLFKIDRELELSRLSVSDQELMKASRDDRNAFDDDDDDDYDEHDGSYKIDRSKDESHPLTNNLLLNSTRVFALADYYAIPELKNLAFAKFRKHVYDWSKSGYADIIKEIYETIPAQDRRLRDQIVADTVTARLVLVEDEKFMDHAVQIPEFLQDAFRQTSRVCKREFEALDKGSAQKVKTLDKAVHDLYQEKKDLRTRLSNRKRSTLQLAEVPLEDCRRCTHCNWRGTKSFSHELGYVYCCLNCGKVVESTERAESS